MGATTRVGGLGVALVLLFVSAIALRLDGISGPPQDFHPTRQYHSALVARGYYLEGRDAPAWKKEIAELNRRAEPLLEPPAMEALAASAYRFVGGEHLWIPRAIATLFWVTGGVLLFLLARRMMSARSAVASLGLYLLLPFGLLAGRSFQPEPLMVMLLLAGALMIVRHHERPTAGRLTMAALVSALATLSKPPMAAFFLGGLFLSLAIERSGRRAFRSADIFVFFSAVALPALTYYVYGTHVDTFLEGQADAKMLPELLYQPSFWRGWLEMVTRVLGYVPAVGTVAGLVLLIAALWGVRRAPRGLPRAILVGLWGGYLAYGLVFTYHIHTHDYYSLALIPIASLSLGPIACDLLMRGSSALRSRRLRAVAIAAVAAASLLAFLVAHSKLAPPDSTDRVEYLERVGALARHTPRAVLLAPNYGAPLKYHGWVAGVYWPDRRRLDAEALQGLSHPPPELFIVTDLDALGAQPDLRGLLRRFPLVSEDPEHMIFDLRS